MSSLSHERLFFALYPPEPLRQTIYTIGQQQDIKGNKHPPEMLHMTLAFLGNVPSSKVDDLITAVAPLSTHKAFTIQLNQLNVWKKPRLMCLMPESPPSALIQCVQHLTQLLSPYGYCAEKRPYSPHVTLMRHYPKEAARYNMRLDIPITWQVDNFCLMRSENTPKGVKYQLIQDWFFAT